MKLKTKDNNLLADLSIFLIVLSSFFYLTVNYRKYQKALLLLGVCIGLLSEFVAKRGFYFDIEERFKVWSWCVLFVWGLSGVFNGEISLVANAVALFGIYYIFCESYYRANVSIEKFLWEICIIYSWFVIYSYIYADLSFSSYKGITYNSNAFGGISAGVFCFCFSYFVSESKRKCEKKLALFICVVSLFNTIISSSRTSFITCAVVAMIGIFLCRKNIKDCMQKNIKIVIIIGIMLGIIVIVAFKKFEIGKVFYNALIAKFIRKKNNPFDGRAEVWMRVWNEKSLWGHGREYFDNIGLGAHNTFMSILGQYGIFAVIVYIGFILSSLIASIKFLKSNCDYRVIPILSLIAFLVMSMAEGMLMKINMLMFYFGLTIIIRYKRNN